MRFYLINKNGGQVIDIENNNNEINKALGWSDAWNCPTITIGGLPYIAICCDTGKMQHLPISAISINNLLSPKEIIQEPFLVGSIIITKFDGIDDFEGLNDRDIDNIEGSMLCIGKEGRDFYEQVLLLD